MLLVIFFCACLLNVCRCADVAVVPSLTTEKLSLRLPLPDINGANPNLKVLEISRLYFEKRDLGEEDKHVKTISNFPVLKEIEFAKYFGQTEMPVFDNVPRLRTVVIQGNKLRKVNRNWFSRVGVKEWNLKENLIEQVEEFSFGLNVTDVNLACNCLREVKASWFQNPNKLVYLNLYGNEITSLEDNFLQNFSLLTMLRIGSNKIETIGSGALSGPVGSLSLHLRNNLITELSPTVLTTSARNQFYWFDIGFNRMNFVSRLLLDKLKVMHFLIDGNPWRCPCLRELELWMMDRKLPLLNLKPDDVPSCVYALTQTGICVEQHDPELYEEFQKNTNLSAAVQINCENQ